MKKIFTLIIALCACSLTSFAYDKATADETYFGSNCKAMGLADGTVAICTYWLQSTDTLEDKSIVVTLPATIEVMNEEKTEVTATYEVSQIGYSTWNCIYIDNNSQDEKNHFDDISNLIISEGVKVINSSACTTWTKWPDGCTSKLTEVHLPSTLTTIHAGAFAQDDNLKSIYCDATTAPELYNDGWTDHFKGYVTNNETGEGWDTIIKNCKVYVPSEEAKATYEQTGEEGKAAWSYWGGFYSNGNVEVNSAAAINEVNTLGTLELSNSGTFNIAGQRVSANVKGLVIENGKKVIR